MAPGFGEDDQNVCEANQIEIGRAVPVDDQGRFTDDVVEWAGQNVFDANTRDHPAPQGARPRRPPRHLRAQLPPLLAHRHADHLQGDLLLVRRGHGHPRPPHGAQPADQLGARPHPRRSLRHVARRRPGLVDLAQPLLGFAHPRVEERRPRTTRGSTSTAASTRSRPTSGSAPTTCTGPSSTT